MLGALAAAAILALATTLAAWLSVLIVAVLVGLLAAMLANPGGEADSVGGAAGADRNAESVKEDVAWIKTQAKSGMK